MGEGKAGEGQRGERLAELNWATEKFSPRRWHLSKVQKEVSRGGVRMTLKPPRCDLRSTGRLMRLECYHPGVSLRRWGQTERRQACRLCNLKASTPKAPGKLRQGCRGCGVSAAAAGADWLVLITRLELRFPARTAHLRWSLRFDVRFMSHVLKDLAWFNCWIYKLTFQLGVFFESFH